ncbi:MAG: twin-arginine translocation pathway signal protein [Acidobacteria bacterium RIFCSPLOWO2_02_FULL_64_15]|nr:MAG: twin-arginine translocation pathway signal protein [Acidobacteria bacterium RIFCSPLOWO2_02_FULL_64_15]
MRSTMALSRRTFLKVSTAGGGALILGAYLPALVDSVDAAQRAAAGGVFEPNIWVRIGADEGVTVMLTQLEMGQGVMTAMPMLVAEELDVEWSKVRTEWVGADRRYGNPGLGGTQITAGSSSVRGYWKPLREAGAAARAMLVTAAAQTWGVAASSCSTSNGEVIHAATNRRLRYGALVDKAATLPVPPQVLLKATTDFKLLGKATARFDIPEKVDGSAVFGIDVTRPGLLVARVVRCPVFGGKVASFNAEKAKAVAGVRAVVPVSAGVAVVADNYWAATRGVQALTVTWNEGPLARLSSAAISRQMASLADRPGAVARNDGDVGAMLTSGARTIERVFEVPFLAHACMEPMNCTADVRADGCDVWVPTQSQTASQQAAMAASGLPETAVKIHTTYLGGGFGRRGEADYVTDAVEASKAVGKPVKVVWTREDDIQHDFYRPATYVRMWGAVDPSGAIVAWQQRIVQQSLLKRINPSGLEGSRGIDFISVDGAATLPYAIPNLRVEYTEFDPGIPYGFWRSVGNSVNGYVTEAFFDELAAAAGKDPFELRRQLLSKAPRHKVVLEKAAAMAGWGTPLPPGRFRGIAVHEAFGSIVGTVNEISVAADGTVRVHKVACAVDCGWTINPDTIVAQMEGGIVYGLTAALKGEVTIQNGRVTQRNFNDYPMLRQNEMPAIDVAIVPSGEAPGGIGEPSTAVIAGSLVNAIFAATGKRIYRLPIRAADLRRNA